MLKPNRSTLTLPAGSRWPRIGLLLVCLFAFFWRLGAAPLFDLDEALYVDCARQMILTGDWVTPRLNSRPPQNPAALTVPFYEKPILVYWASAASQKIFGLNLSAARLPAALAGLLTTGLITIFGIRRFGERAGLLAGTVYAACPLTVLDARQMTTDGLLVLWLTGALLAFAGTRLASKNTDSELNTAAPPFAQTSLFWVFCALAVLTKGIVGVLLPALIIGVFVFADTWANRTDFNFASLFRAYLAALWQTFLKLRPLLGLALFFAIAAPWHVLAARTGERDAQNRTFHQEYVIRQHVNRFRGGKNGDTVHAAPPFMHVIYFAIDFFPWAFFAPAAFRKWKDRGQGTGNREQKRERRGKREEGRGKREEEKEQGATDAESAGAIRNPEAEIQNEEGLRRFLLAWFGTVFVFFSIGAAKLPTYIAPLLPPAALLVGRWLDAVLRGENLRQVLRGTLGAATLAALLFAAVLIAPRYLPPKLPVPADAIRLVQIIMGVLFFGTLAALLAIKIQRAKFAIILLTLMVLAVVGIGATAGYAFANREGFGPYQRLARQANPYAAQDIPIVYYDIVPRTPSTLYRADYSPREFGRAPLLPYLRTFLTPRNPVAIVLCARKTLDSKLQAERTAAPDFTMEIIASDGTISGGWVLLRIIKKG